MRLELTREWFAATPFDSLVSKPLAETTRTRTCTAVTPSPFSRRLTTPNWESPYLAEAKGLEPLLPFGNHSLAKSLLHQ